MTFMALYKGMGDLKFVIAVYRHRQFWEIIGKGCHPTEIFWANVWWGLLEAFKVDHNLKSVNKKSDNIKLPVFIHSACPYRNYGLECSQKLQTYFIIFFFFSYLVGNKNWVQLSRENTQTHTPRDDYFTLFNIQWNLFKANSNGPSNTVLLNRSLP